MWSRRRIVAGIASVLGIAPTGIASVAAGRFSSDPRLTSLSTALRHSEEHQQALFNAGKIDEYFEQVAEYRRLCSDLAKMPANTLDELLLKATHTGWMRADLEEDLPESPQSALVKSVWRDLVRLSNAEVYDT